MKKKGKTMNCKITEVRQEIEGESILIYGIEFGSQKYNISSDYNFVYELAAKINRNNASEINLFDFIEDEIG